MQLSLVLQFLRSKAVRRPLGSLALLALSSFSSGAAHAQGLTWAKRAGGNGYAVSQAIAVDTAGNSYVTGYFTNSVTFGPGEGNQTMFTAPGLSSDIFVAKLNANGALLWARQAGGASEDLGFGITVDASGNCYVVGSFTTSATFAPASLTSAGGVDVFVAKYDASGTVQWVKRAGGSSSTDEGRGIALDGSGNLIVGGYFFGSATFGPGEGTQTVLTSAGQHDVFIAKFSAANGALAWARRAGGNGSDQGRGVGVDAAGNSYIAGYFQNTATFGPTQPNQTQLVSGGSEDVFVAKYDAAGNLAWAKRSGGAASDVALAIAVDAAGNSYVTGDFTSSATFGPGDPSAAVLNAASSSIDIFLARFNSNGVLSWATRAGGAEGDTGFAVTANSAGNSYITGQFRGTASFGTGGNLVNLTAAGVEDVFLAKYDSSGILQWARRDGGSFVETGRGIDVQGSPNKIYATGGFSGPTTFGEGETNETALNGTGYYDAFVARYSDASPDRVGVYRNGRWLLDVNGDGVANPGVDRDFFLGFPGATPVVGDWNGDGSKKAGVFALGYWYLDYNGDGVFNPESSGGPDKQYPFGWAGVTPVVGDWNGDGRDSVGVHANGFWFLDYNGDELWNPETNGGTDKTFGFGGWSGVVLMLGDWNGDGRTKVGLYSSGSWFLDYDGNYSWDGGVNDKLFGFGWVGAEPIVGDWNGDGRDSVAVRANGFWFFDYDGDTAWNPAPGGQDRIFGLGWTGAEPVVGDWNGDGRDSAGLLSAGTWFLDYDASGDWDYAIDKVLSWGAPGDLPFVGPW